MDGRMRIRITDSCRARDGGGLTRWFENNAVYFVSYETAITLFAAGKAVKWNYK